MININLIPDNLRKKKKAQFVQDFLKTVPLEIVIGSIGGFVILLIALHVLLQMAIFARLGSHAHLNARWNGMQEEKTQVNEVMGALRTVRQRIESVEKITIDKRISWSEKLNIISEYIPIGVWLDRVSLQRDTFFIEGSAVSRRNDEMISVSDFSSNLKGQEAFMKGLNDLDVGSIQRRKIQTVEVADFLITVMLDEESD